MKKLLFILICFFFISSNVSASKKVNVKFEKCVDGDTAKFIINNEVKTVRFLGIDTPEISHGANKAEAYGDIASDYTCNKLNNAKSIKLEYDPKSDKTDRYDRVLAWVFVDNNLLQDELISNGLAEVKYAKDDYLYVSMLKDSQDIAKNKEIGIWGNEDVANSDNKGTNLFMYIGGIIAIILVSIFCTNKSKKKKLIKEIKKATNIKF